ncbi:Tricalbin-2, partial [Linderina macrospora]
MAEQQANSSNMPRDNDDSPPSNMPQESLAQGNAPQDQSAATVEAVAKALRTGSDTPSRFHSAALSALSASRQASEAPETNGNDVTAAPTNGKTSEVPTNGSTVANSDGGSATPRDEPEEDRTPLTSRAIYDIAKTKIMTQRALYKLSSETGFVKLRSKPTPIKTAATGSSASGINAAVTNGTPGGDKGKGKEAAKEAAKEAGAGDKDAAKPKQASVVGWKEKGAIDSGKKEAPKAPEPTIFDTINTYIEMVDRSGMWRNCAGVFGLMFLTYVLTSLRFGIFGVAIAAAFGAQWYRNSVVRFRRTVRDDFERAYEHNALTRTLESVGWLNEFTTRFWLMFEPSLSRMVIDIADPILEQNTPGFLDSLKLTTFTLGTKAPRIDGVRTYSELEDRNVIVMDWQVSFTPNDLEDVPAVLRENKVNPKVVLTVRVGKGFVGAGMPIMVEDMVFKGKMQVKLQLGPVFPHVRTAQVCFLERPTIDFVLKP